MKKIRVIAGMLICAVLAMSAVSCSSGGGGGSDDEETVSSSSSSGSSGTKTYTSVSGGTFKYNLSSQTLTFNANGTVTGNPYNNCTWEEDGHTIKIYTSSGLFMNTVTSNDGFTTITIGEGLTYTRQ